MVYIRNWDTFVAECYRLYEASPVKTRYCTKWRHELGLLVLKVTDDCKCLKFKTRSAVYLNRFDTFTRTMTEKMHNLKPVVETQNIIKDNANSKAKVPTSVSGPSTSTNPKETGKTQTGPKKKKGKKKK